MASVKKNVVSALCKHLSVDPNSFASESDSDLKSLCASILKSSRGENAYVNNAELMKWIGFAESFLEIHDVRNKKALTDLNEELTTKSVVMGNGFTPSPADVIVFSALHSYVLSLSSEERANLPHLFRWADYIQNKDLGELFGKITHEKAHFVLPVSKSASKVEDPSAKKAVQEAKGVSNLGTNSKGKKIDDTQKKKVEVSQSKTEKKNLTEKVADSKEEALSVCLLKIQIGHIRKVWKHPSADSLLVEEIDIGEAKCRQVVSGLAKFYSPEDLTNRPVVLITNVKPGKLRDMMSEGLVLCASNKEHTIVEPLLAPDSAKIGECVTFFGHDGKHEEILNPKKKQLDKISPHLFTDEKGVATFKGVPFMTSSGPCTSSIPNASIK